MQDDTFCSRYPRFLETTETIPSQSRLDGRWQAIIGWNKSIFAGRRVIDLGCHDGRWSFAASKEGASHVLGIEGRSHLVEKAFDNFRFYGVQADSYHFRVGDAVKVLQGVDHGSINVMMCLGFYYHTMEHMRLLLEAARIGVEYLIIDTGISPSDEPVIALNFEPTADTRNSIDYGRTGRSTVLVGRPSKSALVAMLDYAGYDTEFFDWHAQGREDWTDLQDYAECVRVTARATRRRSR
jgi:SAM-dependent methyltransferase